MKTIKITPDFLISDNTENSVINTKDIVFIKYNDFMNVNIIDPETTIIFNIRDSDFQYWRYDTKEESKKEYLKIIGLLNKLIVEF